MRLFEPKSRIYPASRLIESAVRGLFRCLIVVATLTATCAAPAVAEVLLSEAESPLEADEEVASEAALPGTAQHQSQRLGREIHGPHSQRDCGTQSKRRLRAHATVGGHRLANGLLAPLRC